jgi:hypothetical protein
VARAPVTSTERRGLYVLLARRLIDRRIMYLRELKQLLWGFVGLEP